MNKTENWDVREYPYIDLTPDTSCDESARAWQGCPSVAVTKGGRVFAAWFTGGAFEPCINNYNLLVVSDDGGVNFSSPLLTVGPDRERRNRNIDAQLWIDEQNCLWLMWTVSPYYESSRPASIKEEVVWDYQREFPFTEVMKCADPDAETLVWSRPRILCEGFTRNKPVRLASGRIIVPAYDYTGDKYTFRISDDGGESFFTTVSEGKPDRCVYDEIALYERTPDELYYIVRTNRGYYLSGVSKDGGNSWSRAEKYEKAPSSRAYIGTLGGGIVAYARNVSDKSRVGIKLCLSEDGGVSFPHEMILDSRERVSYPDVAQDERGNIYVIYDRERDNRIRLDRATWRSDAAKEILLCRVTADDVRSGKLSEGSYLSHVISRAGQDEVLL